MNKPIVIRYDNIAYFDVDETLVFTENKDKHEPKHAMITIAIPGKPGVLCEINQPQVDRLKMHRIWGNGVIVWSKSGFDWAEAVVNALELNDYVDAILAKPTYYYDDKKCCQFLTEHRYLK